MARTFRTTGSGSQQTLDDIENLNIPIYDTTADAEADLANLAEGQIVATKDAGGDEQTLFEYVDGRLETTTTEITMDVFKTGSKAQLYKSGNNVQFRYFVIDSSTFNPITEATWVSIGTIPEGYRPKSDIQFLFQGSTANAEGGVAGMVRIKTDGRVLIYKNTGMNFGYEFSIQCDYNVDGTNSHGMSVNTLKDAKDYTDEQAVRKYNYSMTGTTDIVADIQALCNQLATMGVNTYAGSFLRLGKTHGHYSITVSQAAAVITLNGTVEIDDEQNNANSYTVSRVNNDWLIRANVINKNIVSTIATSEMDYKTAIKAILDSVDFSTWRVDTYVGRFNSNGQAPHQWQGTYQLSKASNFNFGITIMGNANNRMFTGIWANATDGWYVNLYSAEV